MPIPKRPNILFADKVLSDVSNVAAIAVTTTIPMQTMDGDYRCDKFEIEAPGGYVTDAANYYDISLQTNPRAITAVAATDIVTLVAHGWQTGDAIQFTTTGSLPTGLTAGVTYYAIVLTVDTFKVATTPANAAAGTAIDITGAGATSSAAKVLAMYSLLTGQQASLTTLLFASAVNFANPVGLRGDQLNVVLTKFGAAANFPANAQFVAHLKQITNS